MIFFLKCIFLALFLGISGIAKAQITTEGKEFWLGFMSVYDHVNGHEYKVIITSKTNTSGIVSIPRVNWSKNFTVLANKTEIIVLPKTTVEVLLSETVLNNGIYITANNNISVYALVEELAITEASLVLPTNVLGGSTEYYVNTYAATSAFPTSASEFSIVATQDNTEIQITPRVATKNNRPANVPFTINLDRGQVYQVQSKSPWTVGATPTDLSGSYIKSVNTCKPFAVFSGASIARVPEGCALGQFLFEQNYPTKTWGKEYTLLPYKNIPSGYVYKIVASQNNTNIVIKTNAGITSSITLQKGMVYEGSVSNSQPIGITSNNPISVAQFMKSATCNGTPTNNPQADPAMLMMNPNNHTINKLTFNTISTPKDSLKYHYVNILVKTVNADKIKLQGSLLPPTVFMPTQASTGYSYTMVDLNTYGTDLVIGKSFTLESDSAFVAYVYGYGFPSAYAYSGGASFENQRLNFQPPPTACANTLLTFVGTGDNVISYTWNFGDNSPIQTGKTVTHAYTAGGTYTVRLSASSTEGCGTDFVEKTVTVISKPVPTLGDDVIVCENSKVLLDPQNTTINNATATFQWYKDNVEITNATQSTWEADESGIYKVEVIQDGVCTGFDEVKVSFFTLPTPIIHLQDAYCRSHGNIDLTATPSGGVFKYLNNVTTNLNTQELGGGSHEIFYTYQNAGGCSITVSKTISIGTSFALNVKKNYCIQNAPVDLIGAHTGSIFKINGAVSAQIVPAVLGVGKHTITYIYTDASSCKDSTQTEINIFDALPPLKYNDLKICVASGNFINIDAGVGTTVTFNGVVSNRFVVIEQIGKHKVMVQDSLGCITTSEIEVGENCDGRPFIPTAFSPNGDGLNDVLQVFGKNFVNLELKIFNRWGELIFISNKREYVWDGTIAGKPAPAGVYVCTIQWVQASDKKTMQYTTRITLIR